MALRADGLPNIQRQFLGTYTTTIVSPLVRDVRHIAVPDAETGQLSRAGVVVSKLFRETCTASGQPLVALWYETTSVDPANTLALRVIGGRSTIGSLRGE